MLATKSNSYTFQKSGVWYFSRRVPTDLRRHYRTDRKKKLSGLLLILCIAFYSKVGIVQAETQMLKNQERYETYRTLISTAPSIMDYAVMNLEKSLQEVWKEFIDMDKKDGENIMAQAYYGFIQGKDGKFFPAVVMRLLVFPWADKAKILTKGYAEEKCAKLIVKLKKIAEPIFDDSAMINPFLGFQAIGNSSKNYENLTLSNVQKLIYLRGSVPWGDDEDLECGEFWK